MREQFQNRLLAILMFLFGLLFLIFTINWITTISDNMPDNVTLAIYWVGYIILVLCMLFFKPFQLITASETLSIKGIALGLGSFIISSLIAIPFYRILDIISSVGCFPVTIN